MKKTVYFTSANVATQQLAIAINDVSAKRDQFIESNKDTIGNIDGEDLKIALWQPSNTNVMVVLSLSYYSK